MPLKTQSKQWTVADLIVVVEADLKRSGSQDCELINKLREHVDDWTIEDFEAWIFSTGHQGAEWCFLSILSAYRYEQDPIASDLQEYYADELAKMDFAITKPFIEQLLTIDYKVKINDGCLHVLHDIIDSQHPEAEAFQALDLAQPRPGADGLARPAS